MQAARRGAGRGPYILHVHYLNSVGAVELAEQPGGPEHVVLRYDWDERDRWEAHVRVGNYIGAES